MQQQRFFCMVGYHFVHAWLLDRLCLSNGKYVLVTQSLISNTWPDASKEITVGTQISLISWRLGIVLIYIFYSFVLIYIFYFMLLSGS